MLALGLLLALTEMAGNLPFEEKPNWKAKLKERFSSFGERLRGIGRKKSNADYTDRPGPDREGTLTKTLRARIHKTMANIRRPNLSLGGGAAVLAGGRGLSFNADTLQFATLILAILLVTYLAAGLFSIFIERLIPEPPAARSLRSSGGSTIKRRALTDYQIIITRNLFNNKGLIPGDDLPGGPMDQNNVPVKTSLPFNLIGTLVLRNELRSVATIEDRNENVVYPVRIDDEIPGKAKILAIEPYKVIFLNKATGKREFVDLPEGEQNSISLSKKTTASGPAGGGIEQLSPSQFNVSRTEIDKALSDLNKILTEARAVPHLENGVPSGFKLIQIVPGSIYDKLGLKDNDILCGVDGDPINDAGKAFELLASLKTKSNLELCVRRGGKMNNFSYLIR